MSYISNTDEMIMTEKMIVIYKKFSYSNEKKTRKLYCCKYKEKHILLSQHKYIHVSRKASNVHLPRSSFNMWDMLTCGTSIYSSSFFFIEHRWCRRIPIHNNRIDVFFKGNRKPFSSSFFRYLSIRHNIHTKLSTNLSYNKCVLLLHHLYALLLQEKKRENEVKDRKLKTWKKLTKKHSW